MMEPTRKRRFRLTLSAALVLVALIALGLNEYRRQLVVKAAMIQRAKTVIARNDPGVATSQLDLELVRLSPDKKYRQVQFRDRITGTTTTVVIPSRSGE